MSLSPSNLQADLEDVFDAQGTASEAASGIAQAYYDYASDGDFGTSTPTIPTANRDAMAGTILAAISDPTTGSPTNFGAAFTSALPVFWASVPVAGGSGAGATAGCPGASVAGGAITTAVTSTANTVSTVSLAIASALDTATKTVTASLTIPSNPPVVFPCT